ncbi:MAG: RNA polymerase sigma factor ShbA [Haloechinothrix sp.]
MSRTTADNPNLVDAAIDGDPQAISELVAALQPRIVRYCRARIGSRHCSYASADDVAQEVLLSVLGSLPRYRGTQDGLLPFVLGIARHKVTDFYRARLRDNSVPVDRPPDVAGHWPQPEQLVLHAELAAQLSSALDTLKPSQREILVLRLIVGLSTEETAGAVSSTPGAVRVAQHRALAKLRRHLEGSTTTIARKEGPLS